MSEIGDQRSGVLKMLARTFDVGHLAEAFDVFFDIVKKQEVEIQKLQKKANEVDRLKDNISELTKCLKTLEYNIQGHESMATDAFLPVVEKQMDKDIRPEKHVMHGMPQSPKGNVSKPQHHEQHEPVPSSVSPRNTTNIHFFGSKGAGGSDAGYKSILHYSSETRSKTTSKHTVDYSTGHMMTIPWETKRNILYRLGKLGRKIIQEREKYERNIMSMIHTKNPSEYSVFGRMNHLEKIEAKHNHRLDHLDSGLKHCTTYIQKTFPPAFFTKIHKMERALSKLESNNLKSVKTSRLHAISEHDHDEEFPKGKKIKHKKHKPAVPVIFEEKTEHTDNEDSEKELIPSTAALPESVTEEINESKVVETVEIEEVNKAVPEPLVETDVVAEVQKTESEPQPEGAPPAPDPVPSAVTKQSSEEESEEEESEEEEEEDEYEPPAAFGGDDDIDPVDSSSSVGSSPMSSPRRGWTDKTIIRFDSDGKFPHALCEQVREYLMLVNPLPAVSTAMVEEYSEIEDELSEMEETEKELVAVTKSPSPVPGLVAVTKSPSPVPGLVAVTKSPSPVPVETAGNQANPIFEAPSVSTEPVKKEQPVKPPRSTSPVPIRGKTAHMVSKHPQARKSPTPTSTIAPEPVYVPQAPPGHTLHVGGNDKLHSHRMDAHEKLNEKKLNDVQKALDGKVSKGEFEELRSLVQQLGFTGMTREEADSMLDNVIRPEDLMVEYDVDGNVVESQQAKSKVIADPRAIQLRKVIEVVTKGIIARESPAKNPFLLTTSANGSNDDNSETKLEIINYVDERFHKEKKKHDSDTKNFNNELNTLKKEIEHMEMTLREKMASDEAQLTAWKPELEQIKEKLVIITDEQKEEAGKIADEVSKMTADMTTRPTEREISAMIRVIEEAFKRRLGENIGDVKHSVNAVITAVKQKSSKEEVVQIISQRIAGLEQKIDEQKQEEESKAAMSIKCLSCGTVHKDLVPNRDRSESPEHARLVDMVRGVPNTREDYEQMVAVLQGTAGLRAHDRTHRPIDFNFSSDSTVISSSSSKSVTYSLGDSHSIASQPLYRKAKLAAHMKEMVKVPAPQLKFSNSVEGHPELKYVMDQSPSYNRKLKSGGGFGGNSSKSVSTLPSIPSPSTAGAGLNQRFKKPNNNGIQVIQNGAGFNNYKGNQLGASPGTGNANDDASVSSEISGITMSSSYNEQLKKRLL